MKKLKNIIKSMNEKVFKVYINILMVLLLIIQLLLIFNINENIIYACGLFAFIGNNPGKYFKWDEFNTLGLFNDERGGDACGRIVNNKVCWGVDKLKKYKDFVCEVNNTPIRVKSNVVLGHCRKASSGGKADIYAQPVVLFKDDIIMDKIKDEVMIERLGKMKDDDIVFSGIHNGTIENYLKLAENHGINTVNHNDSRVLLSILFYEEYEVLLEYEGTAALIWHNHVLNQTFVYRGESKLWSTSVDTSEEKPLFGWKVADNNWYLSSISDSLSFIQSKKSKVLEVESNKLFKFVNGESVSETIYDRSKCTQNKIYNKSNTYNQSRLDFEDSRYGYSKSTRYPALRSYNAYEEFDEYGNWVYKDDLPWKDSSLKDSPKRVQFTRHIYNDTYSSERTSLEIPEQHDDSLKRSIYNKGRYWMNNNLMHGVYPLSVSGIISPSIYAKNIITLKLYYFVEGIMLDSVQSYYKALDIHRKFMNTILKDYPSNVTKEEKLLTFKISKYAKYAITPLLNFTDRESCFSTIDLGNKDINNNYFTGTINPIFSRRSYRYNTGRLSNIYDTGLIKNAVHDYSDNEQANKYLNESNSDNPKDPWYVGKNLVNFPDLINPMSPFQEFLMDYCDFSGYITNGSILDNETIFMINYMRDFDKRTIAKCDVCSSKNSSLIRNCASCTNLKDNFNDIKYDKSLWSI